MTKYKDDIALALRLPARYKDKIEFLKLTRGRLTRVICDALDAVEVDEQVLKVSREANEKIKEMLQKEDKKYVQ